MPVKSNDQWKAMQAAKHGDPSKLYGAAKEIKQSMKKDDLNDFTRKKPKGLPQHVEASVEGVANLFGRSLVTESAPEPEPEHLTPAEQVENLLDERYVHPETCTCGFCKNKGSFGKKAKNDEKAKEKDMDEPSEPEVSEAAAAVREIPYVGKDKKERKVPWVSKPKEPVKESGTDVKLSTGSTKGAANKTYHNMTSKQAMTPEWKPKAYIKAAGEVSGMNKTGQVKGFKNKGVGQTTSGKALPKTRPGESRVPGAAAKQIVEALLG
jgi:hypothetical protein